MKKSLMALATLGTIAGSAQAQSSVIIYGIVDTGVTYTNKVLNATTRKTGSKFSVDSGVAQGSRLGFKGVEDLGGGLKALFQLEVGFNNDTGALNGQDKGTTNLFRRKSVVGLGSSAGTILLGRQPDALFEYGSWTSVNDFGSIVGAVGHNLDRLEGTRTNNSVRYDTPNLAGFTANAIYGFGETAGQTGSGQSFGFGAQYVVNSLTLFAAYYQSKLGTTNTATAINSASDTSLIGATFAGSASATALKTFSIGASYQAGPARLYGNWSRVKQPLAGVGTNTATTFTIGGVDNSKADIFELGTDYAISAPLHFLASVQYDKLTFVEAGSPKGKLTQINLGTDYFLSKRTDVYAFTSFSRAKDTVNPGMLGGGTGGDNNQAAVTVGVRHKF